MKKTLIVAAAISLASSAFAAGNVGVEFGTNWYKIGYTDNVGDKLMGQGQNFLVYWGLDNELQLGAYNETSDITDGYGNGYSFEVVAIRIAKGIVKNVYAGVNIGSMWNEWEDDSGTLVDIFGDVIIVSGGGEKVSGTVKATVGARFCTDASDNVWNGMIIRLAVGLGF